MRLLSNRRGAVFSVMTALLSCSVPPTFREEGVPPLAASLYAEGFAREGSAFGSVEVMVDGESRKGSLELKWVRSRFFKADFYAPLGIIVGYIMADSSGGNIEYEDRTHAFSYASTMDTLPFSWAQEMRFGEFTEILKGRPPASFRTVLERPPDSLERQGGAIYAVWKTDSYMMRARIGGRSPKIEAVTFVYAKRQPPWRLTLGSFEKGTAKKIELRENDRNYFSIKYAKVNIH
jgi:hypothetical protein